MTKQDPLICRAGIKTLDRFSVQKKDEIMKRIKLNAEDGFIHTE